MALEINLSKMQGFFSIRAQNLKNQSAICKNWLYLRLKS